MALSGIAIIMSFFMSWSFYVYDEPSLMSKKMELFTPQNILVLEMTDDGFAKIDTYEGEKWVYTLSNKFFQEQYFYIFDEMNLLSEKELAAPQIVTVVEEAEDGWLAIDTYKGIKWINLSFRPTQIVREAPIYNQMPKYYNGCESFAATMGLNALGVDTTPEGFISLVPQGITAKRKANGVTIWGDPDYEFVGSMKSNGYATNPPVITNVINENFSESVFAEDITGASYETIKDCIRKGGVVLIWYHPSGQIVRKPSVWYTPEGKKINADYGTHTITILGFDEVKGIVYVNDSIDGRRKQVSWKTIDKTYSAIGQKAVYINILAK